MIKPNAILEIKTKNLIHNYKTLSTIASSSLAGATLKANAYGIGDLEIYKLLYKNNCRHLDRKSTRLNSSHKPISYSVFCLKKKTNASLLTLS